VHLKKLEEAGFVAIDNRFRDNKPLTQASTTAQGRRAFAAYLDAIAGLIGKAKA
jgi:DNA-binding PadR family transcriptional regulator